MNVDFRLLCFLIFFTIWRSPAKGQNLDVGIYVGVSAYQGDLSPQQRLDYLQVIHPAFGLMGRYHFSPTLAVRASLLRMKVSGDDAINDSPRGIQFETPITELTVAPEISFLRIRFGQQTYARAYAFAGATLFYFNPMAELDGRILELQPLGTEAQGLRGFDPPYARLQAAIPLGGGAKLIINERWTVGVEASGRFLFTDYLDDVSDTPLTYQTVLEGNGPDAARLSRPSFNPDTGNPARTYRRGGPADDLYYTIGINFFYRLGTTGFNSIKCPDM